MSPARPWRLNLPPANAGNDPRLIEEAFRRIEDYFAPYGGGAPSMELLARLLGGQHFSGTITQTPSPSGDDDTAFEHNLGRVPSIVLMSTCTDGNSGRVVGLPAGLQGPIGANVTAWTRTTVYVRSTVTGAYEFIVL